MNVPDKYMLRKSRTGEESILLDLIRTVLSDYGLEVRPQEVDSDMADLEKHYFSNRGWFGVIEFEGKIIGSYGIYKLNDSTCELRKMYILPIHQGKGLGKLMLEDSIKRARDMGYREMHLESNRMLTKALDLYKKYGFIEYRPDHLSGRCDIAMRRKI
jgi:putative acetyltransferase